MKVIYTPANPDPVVPASIGWILGDHIVRLEPNQPTEIPDPVVPLLEVQTGFASLLTAGEIVIVG